MLKPKLGHSSSKQEFYRNAGFDILKILGTLPLASNVLKKFQNPDCCLHFYETPDCLRNSLSSERPLEFVDTSIGTCWIFI